MSRYVDWLSEQALAIFLFHGVVESASAGVRNYTRKHIPAAEFREVVGGLAARGNPLSLDDALECLAGATPLPPRSFVVSFDDGFRNNLTVAAPILAELAVPAVFYVTSGFVRDDGASWIDLIEYAVDHAAVDELRLPWQAAPFPLATAADRIHVLEEVRRVAKGDPSIDPYALAAELEAATAAPPFRPHAELDAKLAPEDVRRLLAAGDFTVGGHGHTHRILEHLPQPELEAEVELSLALLAEWTGDPVRHYSYPEGLDDCFSNRVIAVLAAHGIVAAPTALPGRNAPGADPFRLKRIAVA